MVNLQRSVISLSTGLDIIIVHNLNWYGLTIDKTLEKWFAEETNYTAENLCTYIRNKGGINNYIAYTEQEYLEIKNSKN